MATSKGQDLTGVSFMDLAGAPAQAVDYTQGPSSAKGPLPTPEAGDNLVTLAAKMRDLAEVVNEGKSLALFTGLSKAVSQTLDQEEAARNSMTPDESKKWAYFRAGADMPDIDFDRNKSPVPGGHGSAASWQEKAFGLAYLYGKRTDVRFDELGVSVENVAWVFKNMQPMIALVTAAVKYIKAERGLRSGVANATPLEMAEYTTCGRVAGTANAARQSIMEEVNRLNRAIQADCDIVQERHRALAQKLNIGDRFKGKPGPENKSRVMFGQAPIGSKFDLTTGPTGARVKRTFTTLGASTSGTSASKRARTGPQAPGDGDEEMEGPAAAGGSASQWVI
uniref:Uncharacterized protein n=1 Tax=Lactarius rufus RNA virus 1 TaxID=1803570 RepID=A0A7L8XZQ2_9VIRU|nr:hypothetical protein [Lactarius rufus RNA virus 1]